MIIVVDTNILFSACLTLHNKIAEILFSPLPHIERISCYYAIDELFKHQSKIIQLSKLSASDVSTLLYNTLKQVEFISEKIIDAENWDEANRLTSGVDNKDIAFVALTLQRNGILWTGDKKLITHLRSMAFTQVFDTSELYNQLGIV